MNFTKLHYFLFSKLVIAWIAGVRFLSISDDRADTRVSLSWFNQNPFRSIFWAVLGMAAELSTGILLMKAIKTNNVKVSMLVTQNQGFFYKKAMGKIIFTCEVGDRITQLFKHLIQDNEPKKIELVSNGYNEQGELVCTFKFEWSLKLKTI
tara:strand:+ start:3798 stop:4250 length:453 start_codon:yes stop_codon:yes gene_type:complete